MKWKHYVFAVLMIYCTSLCSAQATYDDSESLYYPGDNVTIFHAGNLKQTLTSRLVNELNNFKNVSLVL